MTPTIREVLQGCAISLATPPSPDAGPDYAAGRFGMVAMLTGLVAQEAETAAAAAIAENADLRASFAAALAYDAQLGGRLGAAVGEVDADLSLAGLDEANARLRRLLIDLHAAVEAAGDAATDAAILDLYGRMAARRTLSLGPRGA